MKKLYTARVKVSEYKGRDGSTKSSWETIGNVYENDNGKVFMFLKKYFNPAGVDSTNGDSIMVQFFSDDNNQQQSLSQSNNQFQNNDPFSQSLAMPPLFDNNLK